MYTQINSPYLRKTVKCMHLPKLKLSASHEARESSYQFTGKLKTKSAWSELIAVEKIFLQCWPAGHVFITVLRIASNHMQY